MDSSDSRMVEAAERRVTPKMPNQCARQQSTSSAIVFRLFGLMQRLLMRSWESLEAPPVPMAEPEDRRIARQIRLGIVCDNIGGSLSLRVTNRSQLGVWVEAAHVNVIGLDQPDQASEPTGHAVMEIHEFVGPSGTLQINLVDAIYVAAGRPWSLYSRAVSIVLRCRTQNQAQEFDRSLPLYRVKMIALFPISLRRLRWFDKRAKHRNGSISAFDSKDSLNCTRPSSRMDGQSAVIVKGVSNDGSSFSDSTRALVLSAHGCLVALAAPVKMGTSVLVRNTGTRQEKHCQVVYIGKQTGSRTEVGLAFETAAPEFWGTDHLPLDQKFAQ
jgi:hypothetical protein